MGIDRRQLLMGGALSLTSAIWPSLASPVWATNADTLLIAACRKRDNSFAFVVMTLEGRVIREFPIQGRGHDFAYDKRSNTVVAFARRPGRFALAFNARNHSSPIMFAPPTERHFYGHGTFSIDGRLLYTTENNFESARGVIGVYDATANFARIGEFDSHGVGPHDILLMQDGKILVVANGGIETHPESGREKLNIPTMAPSLCFVDLATGDLIARQSLQQGLHHLSIRHLTSDSHGTVWFGGQWEGDIDKAPGLIGRASPDKPITILEASQSIGADLKGYIGSVAIGSDGRWLAASAPRANRILYFDIRNAGKIVSSDVPDGCGLAAIGASQFAISSGYGVLRRETPTKNLQQSKTVPERAFDNHMCAID